MADLVAEKRGEFGLAASAVFGMGAAGEKAIVEP
jgi:hypothetical protein